MLAMGGMPVNLTRECKAIKIPDGVSVLLPKDSQVTITQVLGGMFTIETEDWYLARIDGRDADALGQVVPEDRKPLDPSLFAQKPLRDIIFDQLKTCYDPEIPVNIVELGLIYDVDVINLPDNLVRVDIQMTLTAPGCGMGGILKGDIECKVKDLPPVKEVNVDLVFDPPWDQSMMSDAAKLELGML